MPLVRIDLPASRPLEVRAALGDAVQRALHYLFGMPMDERFQVIAGHPPVGLLVDLGYLGVAQSVRALVAQVTLKHGRDAAKDLFFATPADVVDPATGIGREHVVSTVGVSREDRSLDDWEAQLA